MVMVTSTINEEYWENFQLNQEDTEFLYNYLLEQETPLTPKELITALVEERLRREKAALEEKRTAGGDVYKPKESYEPGVNLVFPALDWKRGEVSAVREGHNPDIGEFQVIQVRFENGEQREFASGLKDHPLNEAPQVVEEEQLPAIESILDEYSEQLIGSLEDELDTNPGFVRIAGRWFPRALLIDVNAGHLNLAEAVLDMAGGGPLPTRELVEQIELATDVNPKLVEFSLDLAMDEDARFDEVGPAGDVLWYLNRLEPEAVRETPVYLRYTPVEYDRALLTNEMQALERELDDELTPYSGRVQPQDRVAVALIYPHWRAGTLPLSARVRHLFPTSYEAPRIRFMLVDGDTGEQFPGWVVREKRYVYGLGDWYAAKELMPGSLVYVERGKPGEVVISTESRRSSREWVRTVLVGSDGGVVYAMLKQIVTATFDERMAIAVPDPSALDQNWQHQERNPFERVMLSTIRELAKLNPQSHVHASELYAAVNVVRRCPPGPILAFLAAQPGILHVGDLHFRFDDSER